jgi:hypothetical protein
VDNDRYTLQDTLYHYTTNDSRMTKVQADDFFNCEQHCDDNNNANCHSFSYCTKNKECILSNITGEQLDNSTALMQQKSDCVILTRKNININKNFHSNINVILSIILF